MSHKLALTKAFGVGAKTYDYFTVQETINNFITEFLAANQMSSCWVLDTIGVDPVCQNEGWGTALMDGCLREVDRDNLPAFLGCPEEYWGFFEMFDFEIIGEFDYEGIRIVCLYREAQDRTMEEIEANEEKRVGRSSSGRGLPSKEKGVTTEAATEGVEQNNTRVLPKVYKDGLDDALLGDDPIPGLDDTIDQMLQGFFEKLSKITY
eukprot:TRINITY_DN2987_c0_g1_i1.p1 TRINITY_DN2987_c0_g1~~TRINITY_DN2987_c0_g1_i1.p1  ORF type:complete len:207 (+),score=35.64 TRINITY_DN2987_c0_g1_i1:137-757(+)